MHNPFANKASVFENVHDEITHKTVLSIQQKEINLFISGSLALEFGLYCDLLNV